MTDSEAVVNVSSWMDRGVSRLVHGPLQNPSTDLSVFVFPYRSTASDASYICVTGGSTGVITGSSQTESVGRYTISSIISGQISRLDPSSEK